MTIFIDQADADFDVRFEQLLHAKREDSPDVDLVVADIIGDVIARGDAAVHDYTLRFDRVDLTQIPMRLSQDVIQEQIARVPQAQSDALRLAAERIRDYHAMQTPENVSWQDPYGAKLGWRWTPVSAAGLYVPGGLANYPSSVLMNAIPAKVAGVPRLAMVVPTPNGALNPLVVLAAHISGVDEIYRIGGAQAIAALAYGTQTIEPVDKITGPGNAYVAAAKRRVFGKVGIDMIAGPSEILIIADDNANPDWIALDLLSQAEHDESAQSILITTDRDLASRVVICVEKYLQTLPRAGIAGKSWEEFGAIITVRDLDDAAALSDRIAPEHLELCVDDPEALCEKITHAGAIFLGSWTPEAIGDYIGGPNHVLPTARSARFSSGLSVLDFMKRTTLAKLTPEALRAIGPSAEILAEAESLQAHGHSVTARLKALN